MAHSGRTLLCAVGTGSRPVGRSRSAQWAKQSPMLAASRQYLVFARLALPPQHLVDIGSRRRVLYEGNGRTGAAWVAAVVHGQKAMAVGGTVCETTQYEVGGLLHSPSPAIYAEHEGEVVPASARPHSRRHSSSPIRRPRQPHIRLLNHHEYASRIATSLNWLKPKRLC